MIIRIPDIVIAYSEITTEDVKICMVCLRGDSKEPKSETGWLPRLFERGESVTRTRTPRSRIVEVSRRLAGVVRAEQAIMQFLRPV